MILFIKRFPCCERAYDYAFNECNEHTTWPNHNNRKLLRLINHKPKQSILMLIDFECKVCIANYLDRLSVWFASQPFIAPHSASEFVFYLMFTMRWIWREKKRDAMKGFHFSMIKTIILAQMRRSHSYFQGVFFIGGEDDSTDNNFNHYAFVWKW